MSYCTFRLFKTPKGFYAVAQGNLTREPAIAKGEKGSFLGTSIAVGKGKEKDDLRDLVNDCKYWGMNIPDEAAESIKGFLGLRFYGHTAENFAQAAHKGSKIAVCGKIQYTENTNEETGKTYRNLSVTVDNYIVQTFDGTTPQSGSTIACFTNKFTDNDQVEQTRPCLANLMGKVTSVGDLIDGRRRVTIQTDVNMDKAVDLATGAYNKDTNYENNAPYSVSITVYGNEAERMGKFLHKDQIVAVTGIIGRNAAANTGKIYYNMTLKELIIVGYPAKDGTQTEPEESPEQSVASATKKRGRPPKASKNAEPATPPVAPTDADFGDDDDEEGDTLPF